MIQGRFAGRVAVITGGASGIGLAIARRFVAEGGRVVANDIAPERVAALQAELGTAGLAVVGDVTREEDVALLFAAALERFGTVDASFHVAGANRAWLSAEFIAPTQQQRRAPSPPPQPGKWHTKKKRRPASSPRRRPASPAPKPRAPMNSESNDEFFARTQSPRRRG